MKLYLKNDIIVECDTEELKNLYSEGIIQKLIKEFGPSIESNVTDESDSVPEISKIKHKGTKKDEIEPIPKSKPRHFEEDDD